MYILGGKFMKLFICIILSAFLCFHAGDDNMITTSSVSSIPLTYASASDWSVFNATNLASAGNLQANFTDIVSAVSAQYKPALNSCITEINYIEGGYND